MSQPKSNEALIKEFYSTFEGTKFEASYKVLKDVNGKTEAYFPEDWLRTTLAQKDKEVETARNDGYATGYAQCMADNNVMPTPKK